MAELAMGGYALYLIVALGLRMLIQWRLTGASGFQRIGGRVGSLQWISGLLPAVAILGSALAPVLILSGQVQPLDLIDSPVAHAAGLVLFLFGLAVTFASQLGMGRSWRIGVKNDDRTQLVTAGLFSVVRNPIFAATLIGFLGLLLLAPTMLGIGSWLTLLAALELQVRFVEEPYLMRVHGDGYTTYAKRVGRFFPRVGLL